MAVFRVIKDKENPYIMLNKYFIYDSRLSLKSKGLMSYFLSRPDDWQFYRDEILKHCKDGKDSLLSTINELIDKGYIERELKREGGKFKGGYDYKVYETPISISYKSTACIKKPPKAVSPISGKPTSEKPISENPPLLNNECLPNNEFKLSNEYSRRQHQIISYYCSKALTTELHLRPMELKAINKIVEDDIELDIVKQGIDLAFKKFSPSFDGDRIKSFKYCEPVIRHLAAKIKAKENIDGSFKKDNGSNKNKKSGEGELLAERAIKKYGDRLEDFECEF